MKNNKISKDKKEPDSCVDLWFYLENNDAVTSDEALRTAARSLPKFKRKSFEPGSTKDSDVIESRASGIQVRLKHASVEFPYALKMIRSGTPKKGLDLLQIHLYFTGIPEQLSHQWQFGRKHLELLVKKLNPSLAFMNSASMASEGSFSHPTGLDAGTSKLPSYFLPLTYLGPNLLTSETRQKLSKLLAPRNMAFNSGWLMEIIEGPEERPDKKFESVLNKAFKGDIAYYGPQHSK
ncbi:hypothetical protein LXT21_40025 [Myxococcus sp. K38C18041901]|uniref:hypothetical protein n=1 Tax=Myxococcus guangdongensis TaxID=2906760 RepID=UPI0020A74A49|nr:hypothetical protein [Myxococcus guangdongensis]MCP3064980.1 hypothetical protein [Myxococcus guangdongensis]